MKKRYDNHRKVLKKGEIQKKDNLYMYRWTGLDGKRNSIYAATLNDLREQENRIETEMKMQVSNTSNTLNSQISLYLGIKTKLADSTRENYRYYFEHSIRNSALGHKKIKEIKKSDILVFYSIMSNDGYSAGTIKILQKIIRPSLQLACDDGLLAKNPADGCVKEYAEDMEKKFALTFAEEKEFLDRILARPRMKRYYPFYAILLKTGLRISEAIGLTWDDVDMEKMEFHINHQVQYRYINGKVQFYASEPKTSAGTRTIPMMNDVYRLFTEQRKIWLESKKSEDFSVDGYSNFVFVSHVSGKCLCHNSIRRMMRNIVKMNSEREVQLPDISPHILRHTAICRLAESGCDIKVLQYLAGQTDIKITMRVYNHVDRERVLREIERLEGVRDRAPICTPICTKVM